MDEASALWAALDLQWCLAGSLEGTGTEFG